MHKLWAAARFSSIFVYVICCLGIITFVLPFSSLFEYYNPSFRNANSLNASLKNLHKTGQ